MHQGVRSWLMVIMPNRMQEPVNPIEEQLSTKVVIEFGTPTGRFIDARQQINFDSGFIFRHEGQDVGRAFDVAESLMRLAHLQITHDPH